VYLHGGFGSGALQITLGEFPSWAAGQQTTWNRNTASCTFTYENLFSQTFRTADGRRCEPEVVTTDAPTGFVVVYPSGLVDRGQPSSAFGSGHWEDGRSPSPGWAINASDETDGTEYRDDVGFISHVIETVSSSLVHPTSSPPVELPLIDTSRVVVGGTSNGGIMTHRIACHAGHPAYPGLQHLSAAMINVAAMPLNVREGQRGRAACAPQKPLRVVYTVGTGFPTPDCTVYGCQQPTVEGDSRIPLGSNGMTHNANTPTLGRLISHADSMNAWVEANANTIGEMAPTANVTHVGTFSQLTTYASATRMEAVVEAYVVTGGYHMLNAYRADFYPYEAMLRFALPTNVSPPPPLHSPAVPMPLPNSLTPPSSPSLNWIWSFSDSFSYGWKFLGWGNVRNGRWGWGWGWGSPGWSWTATSA